LHQRDASALVDSSFSSRYASVFIAASVLPKIQRATSVISRLLLQTALMFGSRYGSILVDSVLLPLLAGDAAKRIRPPQAEAITRILRGDNAVPATSIDDFVRRALEAANPSARRGLPSQLNPSAVTDACPHLLTNDSALLVFQNVFSGRPALTEATVEQFVAACEHALDGLGGDKLPGSLKFATAIFTLISKYPDQVRDVLRERLWTHCGCALTITLCLCCCLVNMIVCAACRGAGVHHEATELSHGEDNDAVPSETQEVSTIHTSIEEPSVFHSSRTCRAGSW
jgi:hypothetical protein